MSVVDTVGIIHTNVETAKGGPMTNAQKPMSIRFPAEVHDALKLNSAITGDSINDIVVDAVKAHLAATDWSDFDRRIERVRDQYRVALDKLADM